MNAIGATGRSRTISGIPKAAKGMRLLTRAQPSSCFEGFCFEARAQAGSKRKGKRVGHRVARSLSDQRWR